MSNNEISCSKIFHYYWDDFSKFTYMNLHSLKSCVYYHPDYLHIIWSPLNPQTNITWNEIFHKNSIKNSYWKTYFEEIKKMLNVIIIYDDMLDFLDVSNDMSEIHKSDLFRYKILYTYGGIWSDLDIIYIKSINDIINFDFHTISFLCKYDNLLYAPVGLLLSKKGSKFFKNIFETARINYDKTKYQCLGSSLLINYFFDMKGYNITIGNSIYNKNNLENESFIWDKKYFYSYTVAYNNFEYNKEGLLKFILHDAIEENNIILDEKIYMNYNWTEIDELFIENKSKKDLTRTVGFHWFNGSELTKSYVSQITHLNIPEKFNGIIFHKNKNDF